MTAAPDRAMSTAYVAMIAVAMVVGAGIFKSPAVVADNAGSVFWLFAAWVAGGLISLAGALVYAETTSAFPHPGGDYHILKLAYGRRLAFLFAWARFAVINTGSIALLGFVMGDYLSAVAPLGANSSALYAVIAIVALTGFNLLGRRKGAVANYTMTGLEVAALLVLGAAALWLVATATPPATTGEAAYAAPKESFGLALVFVLLAFGGWNEISTLSAEVKDGRRGMARALIGAVAAITVLYLLATWALWRGLGLEGLAASAAPAADLVARAFGPQAQAALAIGVALAAITSINATMIVGARTTYAAAADWPALARLARWDGARGVPAAALWAQGGMALALVGLGVLGRDGFSTLVDYTAPVYWLFIALSGAALIVLRRRLPDAPRPFRTPLYPALPVVFVLGALFVMQSSLAYVEIGALAGLGVLGLGAVAMAVLSALAAKAPAPRD